MHIITSVRSVRLEPTVLASLLDCVRGTVHRVNARLIRPHIRLHMKEYVSDHSRILCSKSRAVADVS